jgi:hypothetical protein
MNVTRGANATIFCDKCDEKSDEEGKEAQVHPCITRRENQNNCV